MENKLTWAVSQVWNEALEVSKDREFKPRDYMWASELGGAYIDRYLKMKGITPTNPPNPRSLRKFEAGNFMEWVVGMVLKRAGIYKTTQEWVEYQYPDLCRVTGKLDFLAGGQIDTEKAITAISDLELPEFFSRATMSIINYLTTTYPQGLANTVIEVKSCSAFMFEKYLKVGADPHHQLQAFHYLKCKNLPEAHIVYISRDDLRMLEFGVFNPSSVEDLYKEDIQKMTTILKGGLEPEKEPLVIYDDVLCKFSRNWKVAYSNYLTMLYGYIDQADFENYWTPRVAGMNRVMGRCIKGDKMTEKNLEIITEAKKTFPNWDELILKAKEKGVMPVEEVEE